MTVNHLVTERPVMIKKKKKKVKNYSICKYYKSITRWFNVF